MSYRFIDLFSGIGGFRIALEELGHQCVFSSEWDKDAKYVYFKNFGEWPEGDITQIPESSIPKHDVLCAGFPCQPFSISGKQLGFEDIRGTLFYDIVRIAEHHQPNILFLENVANIIGHDKGRTLKTILKILDDINYNVFYSMLNASLFGVPQARKRVYFIGLRKDFSSLEYHYPTHTLEKIMLKDISLDDNDTKDLRIRRNDVYLDKAKLNKSNTFIFPYKPIRVGIVNKGGQGERIYHEAGHAITLSAYGGGVGAKTGLYLINGHIRKLHPEECKRLMTFPDNFYIHENSFQAYKQFGNSVIVNLIKLIFKKLEEDLLWSQKKQTKESVKNLKEVLEV